MTSQPLLTIVTPVFNRENYIEECLKNVISQNCPGVEHVIVDGLSTDRTMEIVRRYAAQYPHIRFISEKDTGLSNAINKGLRMAQGKVVSILCTDDFYEPNTFSRALGIIEQMPEPAFVVANCNVWGENQKLLEVNRPRKLKATDLLLGWRVNPFPANPSAYFYHKSLHDKIGYYDERDHHAMDFDFILRAVRHAHLKYVDEVWGNFRILPGTKTHAGIQEGANKGRQLAIINRHLAALPLISRLWVKFRLHIHYRTKIPYYRQRFTAYAKNPEEILSFVKRRLQ